MLQLGQLRSFCHAGCSICLCCSPAVLLCCARLSMLGVSGWISVAGS